MNHTTVNDPANNISIDSSFITLRRRSSQADCTDVLADIYQDDISGFKVNFTRPGYVPQISC